LPAPTDPVRLLVQTCPACGAVHYRNAKPTASALVIRDGQVLLGRRGIEPGLGEWDIPGGFLEPWERPEEGAVRELAEETGLVVRTTELLTVLVDTYQGDVYTLNLYFLAEPVSGEPHPADDLIELRWFGPDELPSSMAFANCLEALATWRSRVRPAETR
jgi:ADP-ribose pyrophosphatase YjhB (NUDIX family)